MKKGSTMIRSFDGALDRKNLTQFGAELLLILLRSIIINRLI